MPVIFTQPFFQAFDDNGNPLSGGKLFTFSAGTNTPKATFTTEDGSVEQPNPVVLDAAGRATVFIDGAYRYRLEDADGNIVRTVDNIKSFINVSGDEDPFFESFSGDGSQTAFTLSDDLGVDEKTVMVFVDGGSAGFEIQAPGAFTLDGTTLTFNTAPASGTQNIYVFAPSKIVGAATSAADAAASSAADAAASAQDAQTAENNAETAETNAAASETKASEWADNDEDDPVETSPDLFSAKHWAAKAALAVSNNTRSPADFGGVPNDHTIDDTTAINDWLTAIANGAFGILDGIYRYEGSFDWPDGAKVYGLGAPRIAPFPLQGDDKENLSPGNKGKISGTGIIFTGTATKSKSASRSDRFSTAQYCTAYEGRLPPVLRDFAIIQDMDVRDSNGNLTDSTNDNRAASYEVGLYLESSKGEFTNLVVFGYFDVKGVLIHSEDDADGLNPDYNSFVGGLITSGVAITGNDDTEGIGSTGQRFNGVGIYGPDHHTRADTNPDVPAVYIDGNAGGTIGSIRGHSFTGCNIRTYVNDSIVLDHADDIMFTNNTFEFPFLNGETGLDIQGGFVSTSNTGDVICLGGAATTPPRIVEFIANTSGKWLFDFGVFDGFMVGQGPDGVRLAGNKGTGDSIIQLTDDLSSSTTKWSILRDGSQGDELDFRFNNTTQFAIPTSARGTLTPEFALVSVNHTSQIGNWRRSNGILVFDLEIEYDSLDTSDGSPIIIAISGLPTGLAASGRGAVHLSRRESTGIEGASGDAIYETVNDAINLSVNFVDADRSEWKYSNGIIKASGKIVMTGYFIE